jgi:hypothetical protein
VARALRKQAKPPKIAAPKPIRVQIGTPNQFGDEQQFRTEAEAKRTMIDSIAQWKPWCHRHNVSGLNAIDDTIAALSEATFHATPTVISCCFDDHTGLTWAARFRRNDA